MIKQLDAASAPKLDYVKALSNRGGFKSEVYKIRAMELGDPNYLAIVTYVSDDFEGQILKSVTSAENSEMHQIEFIGKFDKLGNSSSFYLYQKQKNLLNLFFDVPDEPVNKHTIWERDIYITQIGQSFVPESEERININRLIDTTQNKAGDILAHIGGINHEEVNGNYDHAKSGVLMPVSVASTYYFYGVFNVTQGYWEHNTTIAYVDEQNSGLFNGISVYAIKKVDH
jgi:hypothetical protein